MHQRQNTLNKWLLEILEEPDFSCTPLAGDASFRRYFRLKQKHKTYIVMDAPPPQEAIAPFIYIAQQLARFGVHTPHIYAFDEPLGFMLLEDFGDLSMLKALASYPAAQLYSESLKTLVHIQQCPCPVPAFDISFMHQELALFHDWFLKGYLDYTISTAEEALLRSSLDWLTHEINQQPKVLIHRDYHSRNIMVMGSDHLVELGIIDFQDAMQGPFCYDLVSLLKDCYVQWPKEKIQLWLHEYFEQIPIPHAYSFEQYVRAFDLCGLQRHLKILGIFSRLHLRDHKSHYLKDLPLTFQYVQDCLEIYPELKSLEQWMRQKIYPRFIEKQAL